MLTLLLSTLPIIVAKNNETHRQSKAISPLTPIYTMLILVKKKHGKVLKAFLGYCSLVFMQH